MNLGLSVHMYIQLLSQHFSQDWQISFFFIFCLNFRDHKYLKLTAEIFGKILTCPKMGQFAYLSILAAFFSKLALKLFFFIFCIKLRDHKYSKLMEHNFLGKFLPEIRLRDPKWFNLSICSLLQYFSQDQFVSLFLCVLFLTFFMKLRNHKYSKLLKLNFWQKKKWFKLIRVVS